MATSVERRRPLWRPVRAATTLALVFLIVAWVHAGGDGYITAEWDPSPDPEVVGYIIDYGQSPESYTAQIDVGNVTTVTLWGLEVGQTYYLAARSYTTTGVLSDYSNEAVGQATDPDGTVVPPPAAPSGLTATLDASDPSAQNVNLAWTDNASSEDRFVVERALDGVNFLYLGQAPGPNSVTYRDTSVQPDTAYSYRVIAQSNAGGDSPPSNVASATTSSPPNSLPTANAAGPYSGTVGQSIAFNASGSSDPDGDSLAYTWAFGDGTTASGAQPTHTFSSAGSYAVTLTVSDGSGSDSDTATATVQAQSSITLSARGYKDRGRHRADLTWSGGASGSVDIYRDGARITTVPNGASPYTDLVDSRGRKSYTYQVCEAGTSDCSNNDTVSF